MSKRKYSPNATKKWIKDLKSSFMEETDPKVRKLIPLAEYLAKQQLKDNNSND